MFDIMKQRECFLCDKPLPFNDYISTNANQEEFLVYRTIRRRENLCKLEWVKEFKHWDLIKVWESEEVELLCCHCRDFLNTILESDKAFWELLEWADSNKLKKLKQLGILTLEQLQKIKNK